jgi:hypothetical protein
MLDEETKQRIANQERERIELFTPRSPEEELRIREEKRKYHNEVWRVSSETLAEQVHEERIEAKKAAKEYGQAYLKSVFILNGGSILALLTFIGAVFGKGDATVIMVAISLSKALHPAFLSFIFGLMFAAATSAISYLNWNWVYRSYMQADDFNLYMRSLPSEPSPESTNRNITLSYWSAIVFGLSSLICFAIGSLFVIEAFSVLGVN